MIQMCYVHNQWYDISCATLYNLMENFCRKNMPNMIYLT